MSKPVRFSAKAAAKAARATSFNFGANAPAFAASNRVRAARGTKKKGGARSRSAAGGGS